MNLENAFLYVVFVASAATSASRVVSPDNNASNGVVHVVDTVLLPPGPSPGPGPTGCTGASVNLKAEQCAAWGKFWDGAGGPNWGGEGEDCSKSDPCGCRHGVECGPKTASSNCSLSDSCDSSITSISLHSSNLAGTISNAVGAFVDIETFDVFGNRRLNGSLPASMSAWMKVKFFDVRGSNFNGALPVLNYRAMRQCVLCGAAVFGKAGCVRNAFSCPFPQGVTDKCQKFNGDMEYQPIVNADCYNTTASE